MTKVYKILQNNSNPVLNQDGFTSTSKICITDTHSILILNGNVNHFTKKMRVVNSVRNIADKKQVINSNSVTMRTWPPKNDVEITSEIVRAFQWNWNTFNKNIKVSVNHGWVSLSGEVTWHDQRDAAERIVSNFIGVKGVTNLIAIISDEGIEVSKLNLEHALKSNVKLDATNIITEVSGAIITLKGLVDNWYSKELAGRIAWKTPGVVKVINELQYEMNQG